MTEAGDVADTNLLAGSNFIANDKVVNRVLFVDPDGYELVLALDGFAPASTSCCRTDRGPECKDEAEFLRW